MLQEKPENGAATPTQVLPQCQYCGADPAPIVPSPLAMGEAQAIVFHCGNPDCRSVFSVQLVGRTDQPQGRIVVP